MGEEKHRALQRAQMTLLVLLLKRSQPTLPPMVWSNSAETDLNKSRFKSKLMIDKSINAIKLTKPGTCTICMKE